MTLVDTRLKADADNNPSTRLLSAVEDAEDQPGHDETGDEEPAPPVIRAARWQIHSPRHIVLLASFAKFCVSCTGTMLIVPLFRLIEDTLCHAHFEDDSGGLLDEMKCKEDAVQARLATLLGWTGLANAIFTLIVSFPFGAMADRIGRKPTLMLSFAGQFVSMFYGPFLLGPLKHFMRRHPYFLLTGNIFMLFGGGIPVLFSLFYAIVADVSTEHDKAANFLYLSVGAATGGLAGPLLAGVLMTSFGPWVPIWIVIITQPLVGFILLILPETLVSKADKSHDDDDDDDDAEAGLRAQMARGAADLRASLRILRNPSVPILLITFLFQNARVTAYSQTLVQYVSKSYGWTLGQTSILLSPLSIMAIIVLGGMPLVAKLLVSRAGFSVFAKDLFLTRLSTFFLVVGGVVQGFSPSVHLFIFGIFIATLGAADSPLARATVSHYVKPEFNSRLYALIGMVEVLGSFIGAPVLAKLFNIGLEKKGLFRGLPYFYVSLLSAVALATLVLVRPPKEDTEEDEERHETVPSEGEIRL